MTVTQLAAWCAQAEKRYGRDIQVVITTKFLGKPKDIGIYYAYDDAEKPQPMLVLEPKRREVKPSKPINPYPFN